MNKRIVFLLAVVLAVALSLPRPAAAAGMTISDATSCVQDDVKLNCTSKKLVNTGVSYGVRTLLDVAYVDTVTDKGGGESQPLEETLRFEITKTPPMYLYPLRYLHIVPYSPHEEVRKIPNSSVGIQSCIDGDGAKNPSCGWTLDSAGKKIPYSQGFCSNRDLLQLKTCNPDTATWRGEEVLGEQSTLTNSFSIAHCLRQGDVFFDGYEIDPPRRSYEVSTKILKGAALLNEIKLTPENPSFLLEASQAANGHGVRAELIGEARPPVAPPDLSNYILYVPSAPVDHPYVVDWPNNMLLVPREMVTIDGSECNKVGASFSAFRKQGMVAPTTVAGDCLANQLYQLHASDLALLTQDPLAETNYLVSGKKMFKPFDSGQQRDTGLALQSPSPELNYSTVALALDDATIGFVTNEAISYIKEAYIKTFMAMTKNGTMVAIIKNAGTVRTDYIATVTDCVPGIIGAVPAQAHTMDPNEEAEIDFDIATSQNMDSSHMCVITLRASTGRKFDFVNVYFDTKKHNSVYARDLLQKNTESKKAN